MTASPAPHRITGPLKSWYEMHEALSHEVTALAETSTSLTAGELDRFAQRFAAFDRELRTHSEVEDGIMFPAIERRGGTIPAALVAEHREEQLRVYELGTALLRAKATPDHSALSAIAPQAAALRDSLRRHLEHEEADVLGRVDDLFTAGEQAGMLRTIMSSLPADPHLQAWVAAALTPEHLEARLRNMAASLSHAALVGALAQIHDGVDAETWARIRSRTPDLAAMVPGGATDRPNAAG